VQQLAALSREAGCNVRVEPTTYTPAGRRKSERPDLAIIGATAEFLVDVSVISLTFPSHVDGAAKKAGHAARKRSQIKHAKYDELSLAEHAKFSAFIMESFGALRQDTVGLLRWLAREASARSLEEEEAFFNRAVLHMSVALQRGNAKSVLDRARVLRGKARRVKV
jgi:hypothetical protein